MITKRRRIPVPKTGVAVSANTPRGVLSSVSSMLTGRRGGSTGRIPASALGSRRVIGSGNSFVGGMVSKLMGSMMSPKQQKKRR